MISVEITDDSKLVSEKIAGMGDHLMALMAAGVETQLKTSGDMPFDKGAMKSSARFIKNGVGDYEVQVTAEYAAAQEAGTTRGFPMEHYTTPGTGPNFFEKAVNQVKADSEMYIDTATNAAGLGVL